MLPAGLRPMLATTAPLPVGAEWGYEVKWDGFRVLAWVEDGRTTLRSRSGRDLTTEYAEVSLDLPDCVVDGELVVLVDGRPDFGALQQHLAPATLVPFDLLHLEERSTLQVPWEDRRALLAELCPDAPAWFEDGVTLETMTRAQGLEGVVAKRRSSPYLPGVRSYDWRKVKHARQQSAIVGGWKAGEGARAGRIGSLLLGLPAPDGLRFCGHVGGGFSDRTLAELQDLLAPLARATPPFVDPPGEVATWVEPQLVVEVEFAAWTGDGRLRHPRFRGVRHDLAPEEVVRE